MASHDSSQHGQVALAIQHQTPFYVAHRTSSPEQQRIEACAPDYLVNVIRIITETGLRVYKELALVSKNQVDLENRMVWILESKTPNGVAEVPLTDLAINALQRPLEIAPW